MDTLANTLQNNTLSALSGRASKGVVSAIEKASAKSGVDFAYMVQQAAAESNFKPDAKAKTSSAAGLYQFINSTWMSMIEKYGDKHGVETQGMTRRQILDLRYDPEIASNMAAELASENKQFLDLHWGGDVGSTELYFAHFLGAGKAAAFMKARDENGLQPAAHLFPKEAASNYNVFYDSKNARARTLDEVYAFFDKKFQNENLKPAPVPPGAKPNPAAAIAANNTQTNAPIMRSDVFRDTVKTAGMNAFQIPTTKAHPLLSNYQSVLNNPLDLIMLTQLEMPSMDQKSLEQKTFGRKSSLFQ